MDCISHLEYSLGFCGQNELNYNQFSEGSKNTKKILVLKGLRKNQDKICLLKEFISTAWFQKTELFFHW